MRKVLFLIAILPFVFAACDPVEPSPEIGDLSLNIQGQYDNQTLILNDHYDYVNGQKVSLTNLIFYMSDVRLITDAGNEVSLDDVNLVNFAQNHSLSSTAINGETITFKRYSRRKLYRNQIWRGLPASLNATNPADYASDHPMSKTEYYWDWRGTYIFSVIEGLLGYMDNGSITPECVFDLSLWFRCYV